MPHLIVYAAEGDLVGREADLITTLTEAVVDVYGEWARGLVVVQLIGVPDGRWGVGGEPACRPAPRVTFGIRDAAFARPDADEIVARLVTGVTEAVVAVVGEQVRPGVLVELVGTPAGRSAVGGEVVMT